MHNRFRALFLLLAGTLLASVFVCAQDQPSLGDVARAAREKKQQQAKDAQAANAQGKAATVKPARVITEDEMPEHTDDPDVPSANSEDAKDEGPAAAPAGKLSAEEWHSKIQAQKSTVDTLTNNIDELNKSIQFAPGNCVAGCVEWNEKQKHKQEEVEQMKGQLDAAQKKLSEMQDAARQQGYGSSVYEP